MGTQLRPYRKLIFLSLLCITAGFFFAWFHKVETPSWETSDEYHPSKELQKKTSYKTNRKLQEPFTFISYNVKNWLVTEQNLEKSSLSKAAVIQLLARQKPDIIGLCEIGSKNDLAEIQKLLSEQNIHLPYTHYTGGEDPIRHLGLLSRFPLLSTQTPNIQLETLSHSMQRGILDATVKVGDDAVRFIGLHLKSKRFVNQFDHDKMRMEEANRVRAHLDEILNLNPDSKIVVYGDLNDGKQSLSTRMIFGGYQTPNYMTPISVKDRDGDLWTYFYEMNHAYTRIDFIATSSSLRGYVKKDACKIIDDPEWKIASDHRAILARFE